MPHINPRSGPDPMWAQILDQWSGLDFLPHKYLSKVCHKFVSLDMIYRYKSEHRATGSKLEPSPNSGALLNQLINWLVFIKHFFRITIVMSCTTYWAGSWYACWCLKVEMILTLGSIIRKHSFNKQTQSFLNSLKY